MTEIDVTCVGADGAWDCAVRVRDDTGATDHEVIVAPSALPPGVAAADADAAEALVRATFGFLLEREPKEAILRRFDLDVVRRYFPDYDMAMAPRRAD